MNKYSSQGYSGKDLWKRIIEGAQTPNKIVNKAFGF